MKKTYVFKAISAEGFGGVPYYTETVIMEDTPEAMRYEKTQFALRYGVEFESITVREVKE